MPEMSTAMTLARAFVAGHSIGQLAALVGYSRATVSLYLAGKYAGRVELVEQKLLAQLQTVDCPFSKSQLTLKDCRNTALASAPTHNPMKRQHWQACQRCQKRPTEDAACKRN